ncbi:dynein axonemal intermediate chain 1-like isoform X3 [Syngnathoides biaculeatus]|uniref:dynein axonemal intermediate chain 1-like isoform X3 n=1 Tax=Syngnathoides biaculeatus TaxID=300417 RepID=UPI002ADE0784|nr:dynein axonemal intermediate chain 1-like isoform X3 [Syngnathoides biaculeatus]
MGQTKADCKMASAKVENNREELHSYLIVASELPPMQHYLSEIPLMDRKAGALGGEDGVEKAEFPGGGPTPLYHLERSQEFGMHSFCYEAELPSSQEEALAFPLMHSHIHRFSKVWKQAPTGLLQSSAKYQAAAKSYKTTNKKKEDDDPGKLIKPADQVELTEAELKEEITKTLTARNPHAPQNIAHYKFNDGAYKLTTVVNHMAVHFVLEGCLEHQDFDDSHSLTATEELTEDATGEEGEESDEDDSGDGGEEEEAGEDDIPDSAASKANAEPKCTNQFNFIERSSQTINNPLQGRACQTVPPPRCNYYATAFQWDIYDVYMAELQKQEVKKEKQKDDTCEKNKKMMLIEKPSDDITQVSKSAKLLERMVNQNTFNEVAQDFKYFEDAADEFRDEEGTVLPLWKFQYDKAKMMCVTALCWNFIYPDFFGVGLGSYDFSKQGRGMLLFYTLKNSTYPEYIFPTGSGVLSLDIHKQHSYLVAVGFYDGCVCVYNLKNKGQNPQYKSTVNTGKHTDPVWQVRWQNDNSLNFYSVSSDGRVVSWMLIKNELAFSDALKLTLDYTVSDGLEGIQELIRASGTSFDFHTQIDDLFIVGTEEGKIHKCSKNYSSQYLKTYEAHNMAVGTVRWNPYHSKVFISCSSDWSVKIWDQDFNTPMFTFELHASVGDVAWAPYSSTVFAAVTTEGLGKKGRDLVEGPEAEVAKMEKLLSLLRP